jgi:hypothetical protein
MSIAKIDIDILMDEPLLSKFIETRLAILKALKYTCRTYRIKRTEKGYHFWFRIDEKLGPRERADLQFLLGDDQSRVRFNYLRIEANCFDDFNALFSKKKKTYTREELLEALQKLEDMEGI